MRPVVVAGFDPDGPIQRCAMGPVSGETTPAGAAPGSTGAGSPGMATGTPPREATAAPAPGVPLAATVAAGWAARRRSGVQYAVAASADATGDDTTAGARPAAASVPASAGAAVAPAASSARAAAVKDVRSTVSSSSGSPPGPRMAGGRTARPYAAYLP